MDKENKQMDDVEEVDNTVCEDINGSPPDSNFNSTVKANSSTDSYPYLGSASSNADSYSDSDTDVDFEPCSISESSRENSKLEKKFRRLFESEVTSTPQNQTDPSQNKLLTRKNMDKDKRISHRLEKLAICDMYSNKCCRNNCIKVITHDIATIFRKKVRQFSEKERELMIQAHLAFYRQDVRFSNYYKNKKLKRRQKKYIIYKNKNKNKNETKRKTFFFFRHIQICRKLYLFLYDLELEKYKQIVAYFDEHELEPSAHKLVQEKCARKIQ